MNHASQDGLGCPSARRRSLAAFDGPRCFGAWRTGAPDKRRPRLEGLQPTPGGATVTSLRRVARHVVKPGEVGPMGAKPCDARRLLRVSPSRGPGGRCSPAPLAGRVLYRMRALFRPRGADSRWRGRVCEDGRLSSPKPHGERCTGQRSPWDYGQGVTPCPAHGVRRRLPCWQPGGGSWSWNPRPCVRR